MYWSKVRKFGNSWQWKYTPNYNWSHNCHLFSCLPTFLRCRYRSLCRHFDVAIFDWTPDLPNWDGLYLSYLVAEQIVMTVITEGPGTGAGRGLALIKNGPGATPFLEKRRKGGYALPWAKKRLLLKTGDYFGWRHFSFPVVKVNCHRAPNRVKMEDCSWGFCEKGERFLRAFELENVIVRIAQKIRVDFYTGKMKRIGICLLSIYS